MIDDLEMIIRKRLGQKRFDPINEQKHKRFDFSKNNKSNNLILSLFDDFKFSYKGGFTFNEIFNLSFYKGECLLIQEEFSHYDEDIKEPIYKEIVLNNYTGYGTVDIIKEIIINYSFNYKNIIRDTKLNILIVD